MEIVYRPWESPIWIGADGWQVWRRDPGSLFSTDLKPGAQFTGHVRAGYDVPDTETSLYAAAGQYLAGDLGATMGLKQGLPYGIQMDASLTWSDRTEYQGFFRDTKFDPKIRFKIPLGGSTGNTTRTREARVALQQMGRDGGQMLNRPMKLEDMTEAFSIREVTRNWADMLQEGRPAPSEIVSDRVP